MLSHSSKLYLTWRAVLNLVSCWIDCMSEVSAGLALCWGTPRVNLRRQRKVLQQPDKDTGERAVETDRNMGHQVQKKQTHSPIYQICSVNSCSQRTSSHHHGGQQTVWSSAHRQLSWEGPIMAHRNRQAGTKLGTQRGLLKPGTSGTMHGMPLPHHMKWNHEPFNLMYKQSLKSQLARSSE